MRISEELLVQAGEKKRSNIHTILSATTKPRDEIKHRTLSIDDIDFLEELFISLKIKPEEKTSELPKVEPKFLIAENNHINHESLNTQEKTVEKSSKRINQAKLIKSTIFNIIGTKEKIKEQEKVNV